MIELLHHLAFGTAHLAGSTSPLRASSVTSVTSVTGISGLAAATAAATFNVAGQVTILDGADSAVILVLVLDRFAAQHIFAVSAEDLTQIQSATLQRGGDGAQGLHVFVADASADEVLVAGCFENLGQLAVVVVSTSVLEARGDQGEGRGLLAAGVA